MTPSDETRPERQKDAAMSAQIAQFFSERAIQECLESDNRAEFHICDGNENASTEKEQRTFILRVPMTNDLYSFTVKNPGRKKIHHLAVDHCFFDRSYSGDRCDCIVFDDVYFCFVELKLNLRTKKGAAKHLRKARKQLGSVIQEFKRTFQNNSKDFLGYILEAFIVMYKQRYPKDTASRKIRAVHFLEEYGVALFETNEKVF